MTRLITRFISISFFVLIAAGCSKSDIDSILYGENKKAIGASANDLLSASRYSSVKIEIQYMPGYQPDAASVNNLTAFINTLCNKPGGIPVIQTAIASGGKTTYSDADVVALEKENRTVYTSGSQIGIHFLYLDGNYTTSNVLGYAYRNTSMALFAKKIVDNSGGLGQPTRTKLETTVLEHEMGHILGLVNLGSNMQTNHEDGSHAKHCSNTACLMYYQAQSTDILGPLSTGNIPVLDANCRADLTANGGK